VDELPKLAIRAFDASEVQSASALLKKFADQKLTLADAHGLHTMKELSIRICWSTDSHLGLTGAALAI
jgi:predicted nucleic acid-binding protein